jgi:hypothetical protein
MRDTFLGRLRLWYAVDQVRYVIEDLRYARYGIPNARTAPASSNVLLGDRAVRARFPYIETTMMAEYQRMAELSRNAGARFMVFSSIRYQPPNWELIEDLFGAKLRERRVRLLIPPLDTNIYNEWAPTLQDGHPNFIWAWIMANGLYADLEGQPYRLDFAEMPQLREIPAELDLADVPASVRFLGLDWQPGQGGSRLAGMAS